MIKKLPLDSLVSGTVNAGLAAAGTTNTILRNGSTGSQVKNLQTALAKQGYDVGIIDGKYGPKTEYAVMQYQQDNGLKKDGIAGKDTLGLLNSSSNAQKINIDSAVAASGPIIGATIAAGGTPTLPTNTAQPKAEKDTPAANTETTKTETPAETTTGGDVAQQPSSTQGFSYDAFNYGDYTPSDIVNQANALLQEQNAAKPGAYQSQWQSQIDDYMNQIANRDPFSYNFNEDALYQLYKDNYIQQGRMAAMDTMGQAAAMTGGYGNSYAQTVGQQAYNQQLSQLNNVIPELYQMAFDRYAYEGQQLQDMYNMYLGREEQDYGRYMDSYNAWQAERDYLAGRYDSEREYDYSKWESDRALAYDEYNTGRETAWQEYLTNMEKEQAAAELMAGVGVYDRLGSVYGLTDDELAAIKDANAPKYYGGDDNTGGEDTWDNGGLSESRIKELQKALGVTVDGKWGEESRKAAGGLSATEAYDALRRGDFDDPARPQGTMNDSYEGGLAEARRDAIYDWLANAYSKAGPSFKPYDLIKGSSYLKTQAERDYATILVDSWADIHKK